LSISEGYKNSGFLSYI